MFPRTFLRLLVPAVFAFVTVPAVAQYTRDGAATKKIDEAINQHYFATEFDKAEGVLLGTIKACETKCRPQTVAKAWMYIGIVRGSGRNNQQGAAEAFQKALEQDPQVQLDAAIATPETVETFNALTGGKAAVPTAPQPTPGPTAPPPPTAAPSGLSCSPQPGDSLTRAPIPISCLGAPDIASMDLRFKAIHGERWETVRMQRSGDSYQGQVPCARTSDVGPMSVHVLAKDGAGSVIDSWGSPDAPYTYNIVNQSNNPPLALPGQPPPPRCSDVECPPDFPGCEAGPPGGAGNVGWGGICLKSTQCEAGLACFDSDGDGEKTCETPSTCESDSDCASGSCEDGKCEIDDSAPSEPGAPTGPGKKLWLGLHVGADLALVGAESEICDPELNSGKCFLSGVRYPNEESYPLEGQQGETGSGFAPGPLRFMLSLEYAVIPNLTVGVRAGYAILGAPEDFLPFHAEGRLTYWFGKNPLARTGLRPYVQLGGGMAQVDAHFVVQVKDCFVDEADPERTCETPKSNPGIVDVDAYKPLGQGFVSAGTGLVFAFGQSAGFQLNVQGMYMLPESGIVVEPSLGLVFGL